MRKCKTFFLLNLFFATGMQANTHFNPVALFVPAARPLSVKSHRSLMLSNLRVPMDSMGRFHGCVCFFFLGELYFMSTGVPSATAPHGVVYKVVDTSR